MNDYDLVCGFESLYRAHYKAKKGKAQKVDVLHFESNLAHNLMILQDELKNGIYEMKGYRYFRVYEPKMRNIFEVKHVDKIVMHAVCDEVLLPRLSPHFIYDNAACQKGKGTHFALKRFSEKLVRYHKYYGREFYVLKCDISAYFASIDHSILRKLLRKLIKDEKVITLLSHFIDSYWEEGTEGIGLPLGNQTSQWFALYYLSGFDHYVKEKLGVKGYIRYMDDFLLIHKDKSYLFEILDEINRYLNKELGLKLNPKTSVVKATTPIEFLGWRFFICEKGEILRKLKAQSKMRYRRKMRIRRIQFFNEEISFVSLAQVVASYDGHLGHGNTYLLRKKVMADN